MDGERVPTSWVGRRVELQLTDEGGRTRGAVTGVLEGVSDVGVLFAGELRGSPTEGGAARADPAFYPWSSVRYVRPSDDQG